MHAARVALAIPVVIVALSVSACGSGGDAPSATPSAPVATASAPVVSASPGTPAAQAGAIDAPALVAAMWGLLNDSSKKQLCDMYVSKGDGAGMIFVAGAESDPKADLLSDADKSNIGKAGAQLLQGECAGTKNG